MQPSDRGRTVGTVIPMPACMHYRIDTETNICTICKELVVDIPAPTFFRGVIDTITNGQMTLRFDGEDTPPLPGARVLVIVSPQRDVEIEQRDTTPEESHGPISLRNRAYRALDFIDTAGQSRARRN